MFRLHREPIWIAKTMSIVFFVIGIILIAFGLAFSDSDNSANEETSLMGAQDQDRWEAVDKLVSEQKFQAALREAEKIRAAAQKSGDEEEWTRGLIKEVQLRTGLHGYETAVRFLMEQPWPEGTLHRAALNLFYARALVIYYGAYSWEINQRERMETQGVVDLKAWTKDQLFREGLRAYSELWELRASLGKEPVSRFAEYLTRNNYPSGIRDTMRDAVSYLLVEFLANTSFWKPEETGELYRLNLTALLSGDEAVSFDSDNLLDDGTHPLIKIGDVLRDLEIWHKKGNRPEAALESRLERYRRLHDSYTDDRDRNLILQDLIRELRAYKKYPWWSVGKALEAEFVMARNEAGRLVRARSIAEEGWKAFPDSLGGQRCLRFLKSIEAPDFSVASMLTDGFGKKTIEITHKNITTLHFRAYQADLEERIRTARDYNLFPDRKELQAFLHARKPEAAWSVELPATPDYESHRTFVVPPMRIPGYYIIVASAKPDFTESENNRISLVHTVLTDLVILTQQENRAAIDVCILAGETGLAESDVHVALYKFDWREGHQKVEERTSGADGRVRFTHTEDRSKFSHFLFARKGPHVSIDTDNLRLYPSPETGERRASLIYTDRSIYRPHQTIYWKVLVYGGQANEGKLKALASRTATLTLRDPNGEAVESLTVATNRFGTASGEFDVPSGRLLGRWSLVSSISGRTSFRVEEYKRPTFELTLRAPEAPLRLNRPAAFTGEAKYYFGLPVVNGSVRWRVTREAVYPWWWNWYGWRRSGGSGARTIASGEVDLETDGTFTISFTPEADERLAEESKDISYNYRISADLTDEGGETRSTSRVFRLGFISIEARINPVGGFFQEGQRGKATVVRTDLNGSGRKGKGSWQLVSIKQPEKTLLPADVPIQMSRREGKTEGIVTPGDSIRPRWNPDYSYQRILRSWPDSRVQSRGMVQHDESGRGEIELPALSAGVYRLTYETVDDFGATFKTSREIVVAGRRPTLALPALLMAETTSGNVGGDVRLFVHSGLDGQILSFELWRDGKIVKKSEIEAGKEPALLRLPIREADRGGFTVRLTTLADYQLMTFDIPLFVPWDNKALKLELSTFRDKLRPGERETWRVNVRSPSGSGAEAAAAEILAYMYDKSLDIFAPHHPPNIRGLYPYRARAARLMTNLTGAPASTIYSNLVSLPPYPVLRGDRLKFYDSYGIGGPGWRGRPQARFAAAVEEPMMEKGAVVGGVLGGVEGEAGGRELDEVAASAAETPSPPEAQERELRSDFAETAFWHPHLLTGPDGSAAIEFTVPDSVTSWNVWVHAVTADLLGGSLHREAQSVKELMVRPYLPRFLREGDQAEVKVVVNNASAKDLEGTVRFEILDPDTNASLAGEFGLEAADCVKPFRVKPEGGTNLTFPLHVPARPGLLAFKVTAQSENLSDGELRPLPLLPGRMHLVQSRFVTLKNKDRREIFFGDLKKSADPTLVNTQMVVTVDAQLFYSVLSALPYLVNYPYECTEQTLNRFVSSGILTSLYTDYPQVARMAEEFSKRDTRLETWDAADPNRKMAFEETPWLFEARGGREDTSDLVNVLDPRIAAAEKAAALAKLRKAQTAIGAFPWWPGGPPSPYMTLYIMYGLAKAAEFGVDVPREMVERGWSYLAKHYREEYAHRMLVDDCCWEFLTFLNYTVSCYPDPSWVGDALTDEERELILNHCFKHWRQHSPYLKGMLALTLLRMNRPDDAVLVFDSVMDSAITTQDEGTFWTPEDRSWLWYNDTIETHAFALRTLMELAPGDPRRDGLVQWLFLNKKLNHWKSTRATAEVIYSLVHYLKHEKALGLREEVSIRLGGQTVSYVFEPDKYAGKKNQTVIPGGKLGPEYAVVTVEKDTKGFAFASATWHFSTEKLPERGSGDFFAIERTYFRRVLKGKEFILRPLAEGEALSPGDEVEIHISIKSKHAAEYVHLRDPRAAGLEPENPVSRYKWDLGISWYEETRDSGTNFFFEWLPAGEYTFKYRLRANMSGVFKVSPATLQSMYAPEFNAYSAGAVIAIDGK